PVLGHRHDRQDESHQVQRPADEQAGSRHRDEKHQPRNRETDPGCLARRVLRRAGVALRSIHGAAARYDTAYITHIAISRKKPPRNTANRGWTWLWRHGRALRRARISTNSQASAGSQAGTKPVARASAHSR